ncbi:MAG: hypothetical protein IKQ39_04280 [Oscillospiraceae bacterium]|nr:hypothetical protein [Oscillospiraceae bacterium]
MKKKILAILSAAVLGCCALTAPAFAEETAAPETKQTYQPGDVDMDGEITAKDASLALKLYVQSVATFNPLQFVTEEQYRLANIVHHYDYSVTVADFYIDENGHRCNIPGTETVITDPVDARDAQFILKYYVMKLAGHPYDSIEEMLEDEENWEKIDRSHVVIPEFEQKGRARQ